MRVEKGLPEHASGALKKEVQMHVLLFETQVFLFGLAALLDRCDSVSLPAFITFSPSFQLSHTTNQAELLMASTSTEGLFSSVVSSALKPRLRY
eukprot:1161600-Pelagomonas_calceolata.AAC.8